LQKTIAEKNEEIEKLRDTLKRANKYGLEADKEINRQKHVLDFYALQYGTVTDQSKKIKEIKDEAYKEFAKRLKKHMCSYDLSNYHYFRAVDEETLDGVLKELTEGSNDERRMD
jgi:hypothetical protein